MAITHHQSSTTIRGITYNYGQAFTCSSSQGGAGDAQGNGAALALDAGSTYYYYGYATGDDGNLTAYPYLIYVNSSTVRGWYKENVFPYATFKITFNPNGGTLKNPGGNLNNGTNTNSVTITYTLSAYYAMSGDIPIRTGYAFNGWYTSPNGGTQVYDATGHCTNEGTYWNNSKWMYKGNVTLYAQWTAISYTNTISHWLGGLKNGEGNNSDKSAFKITDTSFIGTYDVSFLMDSNKQTTIPNGFSLRSVFRTPSISGEWNGYNIGTTVSQKTEEMWFEYYYDPIAYNITYNLDGGTNDESNPSTYNVLYEVALKTPTRTGYGFNGWYNRGSKVTGINQGCNATFSDASDLYSKLSLRTTGNITLTAQWTANAYTVIYHGNGGSWNNTDSWSNTATYDNKYTVEANFFTRIGYTFVGWTTNSDGADDGYNWTNWSGIWSYLDGQHGISNGELNLYAIWEPANVGYLNIGGSYSLCNTHININGTYKPAIVYKKINGSWGRSVVK